jgi:hypothetical protein
MRFGSHHLQVFAVGLDQLCEILLAHHGAEVREVVDLLDNMVQFFPGNMF